MAPITSLAPELLQRILDLSDPPEHLNLALTSKTLHTRLNYILRYSQACHQKYRAVSDIQPSTIPDLVRLILFKHDRVAAWHIRAIEIWGHRGTFADWKPYPLLSPVAAENTTPPAEDNHGTPQPPPQEVYQDGYFTSAEQAALRQAMIDLFKLDLGDEYEPQLRFGKIDPVMNDLSRGDTAFLAVLLMALSPRLEAIRFVRNPLLDWRPSALALAEVIDYGQFPAPVRIAPLTQREKQKLEEKRDQERMESGGGSRPDSPDDKDETEIVEERENQGPRQEVLESYPPGFLSVKKIAVGLWSKAQPTSTAHSASIQDRVDMEHIGPLLHLPRLKSLWIHGFSDSTLEVDDGAVHWGLPVGCSSVENLVFDCPEQPEREAVEALVQACGQLKHVTFIDGGINETIDCDFVLGWCEIPLHAGCLKSVLWCGTGVHGYRSDMFYANDYAEGFDILTISADDLILCGVEFPTNEDPPPDQLKGFVNHLYESIVGDARVLVTHDSWGCPEELLEQALIQLVRMQCWDECWEKNENEPEEGDEPSADEEGQEKLPCGCVASWGNHGQYPHFPQKATALYLEGIDPWINTRDPLRSEGRQVRDPDAPPRDRTKRPFGELIKWCKLWGVEIYTRTTPAPRVHNVAMPTIASEKDLQTSPWYKHPAVEKLYFKPDKGLVGDCGNCGECKKCFKRHPKECWAKWKEEDAQAEEQRKTWEAEEEAAETESEDEGSQGDGDDAEGHKNEIDPEED